MAFDQMDSPVPIALISAAFSNTVTCHPACRKAIPAVSPPMPPPTTTADFCISLELGFDFWCNSLGRFHFIVFLCILSKIRGKLGQKKQHELTTHASD